jgi:membrane-associated protein
MQLILDIFQNLPTHLHIWAVDYGMGLYVILFLIIFAETGLVVTPILPGDSLLFATGALLSMELPGLSIWVMIPLLIVAAILGDLVNYHIGQWAAPKIFAGKFSRWLNRKHLQQTEEFYRKHGGKTVVLARFVPIVRTYAPFVAGMGAMNFSKFIYFNVTGGIAWITSFILLGYFFGQIPAIKSNFQYVILGIIVVSVLPIIFEFYKARRARA